MNLSALARLGRSTKRVEEMVDGLVDGVTLDAHDSQDKKAVELVIAAASVIIKA